MRINKTLKAGEECEIQIEAYSAGLSLTILTGQTAESTFYFDHVDARAMAERIINALDNFQLQNTKE